MNTIKRLAMRNVAASWLVAILLTACVGSGSSDESSVVSFREGTVNVTKGSHREVILSLQRGSGIMGRKVTIASANTSVAEVSPTSCTLSDSSDSSSRCTVKIHGKSKGSVVVIAKSSGQGDVAINASVGEAVVYGSLAVANSAGAFVTTSPVSVPISAQAPYLVTLQGTIQGSSGITTATSALINFSTSVAGVTINPPQCQVTTSAPTCTAVATLPSSSATTFTAAVVGGVVTNNTGYTSIAINATAGSAPPQGNGTIALSTQSGNNVSMGMKAPLFVNWTSPSAVDIVAVNLTISGNGVTFYSFTPGNNTAVNTSVTQSCTLAYTATASTTQLNCGLGLVGTGASGTVTISGTATGAAGTYTIAPLTLGVVTPDPTRRSVTFTNSSSQNIYVGITGGAASSYLNATTPAIPPGTPTANLKPGAGSLCGPSNPQAACPIGTTCIQGGAGPNASVASTPFYCYYDQPTPTNGYELAANAGTTTFNISGSSLSPNDIFWSGNFYARTGCDSTTGVCENATCVGSAGGLVCGPGTGPTPGTNTLAEATFQMYPSTDFYDVSIINGINFATSFGPSTLSAATTNGYFCGTAGSSSATNGGYLSGSTAGLPAAPWTMTPTNASFPPGVTTLPQSAASYFRVVHPSTSSPTSCTSNRGCTSAPDTACGWPMSSVKMGSGFNYQSGSQVCGKPVAWMTADTIWGQNSTASNQAPFAFNTSFVYGNGETVAVSDLQLCINNTYSAYIDNGASSTFPIQPVVLACGGVMWDATESPLPQQNPASNVGQNLTQPTQSVQTANANWLNYVLPTIQWLKQACPTCYTYPFDDMSSTFTCSDTPPSPSPASPSTAYGITFSDLK